MASAGDTLAEVPVWMGDHQQINITAASDIELLVPAVGQDSVETRIEYRTPLEAPIEMGSQVAELVVIAPDMPEKRIPLVSDRNVERGGFLPRVRASATVLFDKAMGQVQSLME
jgi:D-alanyl-D-alanine carboxypeptidase (penicillin-binding protein 5/6)